MPNLSTKTPFWTEISETEFLTGELNNLVCDYLEETKKDSSEATYQVGDSSLTYFKKIKDVSGVKVSSLDLFTKLLTDWNKSDVKGKEEIEKDILELACEDDVLTKHICGNSKVMKNFSATTQQTIKDYRTSISAADPNTSLGVRFTD